MNLYLIWQEENNDYDTYDSAIVCAKNGDEAVKIHPSGYQKNWKEFNEWASAPEKVYWKLIGTAASDIDEGIVVLASFNAG